MKSPLFIDRKSPQIVEKINIFIHQLAKDSLICERDRPYTIMEVCGTHTMSIYRYGLKDILPSSVRLVSGPGCPVCVTPSSIIEEAIAIASKDNITLCTFGDMMRVPADSGTLSDAKNAGADIRIIYSPMEALKLARDHPEKEIVFFAVGFETTAPLTAAVIEIAKKEKVNNFSIICGHKTMPQALRLLLKNADRIDALLCPGHVATITGAKAFSFVPQELKKPAAIAGFEAVDIMEAVCILLKDAVDGVISIRNAYRRSVKEEGNTLALATMNKVFSPDTAVWRGLGEIEASGLRLAADYEEFDATKRFPVKVEENNKEDGCRCGEVLQGLIEPADCQLMAKVCTPYNPRGACMVSSEGSCAAYYKYGRRVK